MGSFERSRIQTALDNLAPFLAAYVEQAMKRANKWEHLTREARTRLSAGDLSTGLRVMKDNWSAVFEPDLPRKVRNYLFEVADTRNDWAHQYSFTPEDASRAIETIRLLSAAIGARSHTNDDTPARTTIPKTNGRTGSGRAPSQRDVMRAVYAKCGGDDERAVRQYAEAERRGEVHRGSNAYSLSPEQYARALLADGKRKGWL